MAYITKKDVAVLAVLIALVLMTRPILSFATGTEAPIAVVKGNSMLPLLREGDIVFLYRASPQDIKVGDIVVYKSIYGGYIIHRVVKIVNETGVLYFVTKGDNNPIDDSALGQFVEGPGITYDRIIGVVWSPMNRTFVIPVIGIVSLIL